MIFGFRLPENGTPLDQLRIDNSMHESGDFYTFRSSLYVLVFKLVPPHEFFCGFPISLLDVVDFNRVIEPYSGVSSECGMEHVEPRCHFPALRRAVSTPMSEPFLEALSSARCFGPGMSHVLAKWSLLVSAYGEYFRKRGCILDPTYGANLLVQNLCREVKWIRDGQWAGS
nr:hypothetical protein [Tanacetum cinerariifolium]